MTFMLMTTYRRFPLGLQLDLDAFDVAEDQERYLGFLSYFANLPEIQNSTPDPVRP